LIQNHTETRFSLPEIHREVIDRIDRTARKTHVRELEECSLMFTLVDREPESSIAVARVLRGLPRPGCSFANPSPINRLSMRRGIGGNDRDCVVLRPWCVKSF
jgi:hypothetical protein